MPRPRLPLVAALLAATALIAGCGGPPEAEPAAGSPTAGDGAGFPVVVPHAFGETTIPAKPQRVVALGLNDVAVAQTVGAPLVGAIRNVTGEPNLPYLEPLPEDVVGLQLDPVVGLEQVAAYRPDMILAVSYPQLEQSIYDDLTAIAPVVTFEKSLYGSSMQDDARQIGRALGEQDAVEGLIADAEQRIAEVREELPGLQGATYLYGQARGDVLPLVVGDDNLSTVFMNSLGLQVPGSFRDAPASDALAPGTVGLSYEEASRLDDADLLFMTFAADGDRSRFEGNELVQRLSIVREDRYRPVDLDEAVALQAPSVVSTGWLIDRIRPALEQAAG
ncbi:ABC transporter substrate-binding protein [Pseudonocardia nematodicida]|uniref:ABC transporter substrate-binding protein n=1 Tax=Pseudonocardia nematodicida TaxID=1206997 RepID=A0ABV1KF67_9PSEU